MDAGILHTAIFSSLVFIALSPLAVTSQRGTPPTIPIVNPTTPTPPFTTGPPAASAPPAGGGGGGSWWCVAGSGASEAALQVALDYACGYGGTDCSAIQPNGPCYEPNTVRDHASYAFNEYYQKNPAPTSCVFGGTAQLTNTDPSRGNCRYTSSPPRSTLPPAFPMTPPSPTTSMNPYPPVGTGYGSEPGYTYGNEPTSTPNSAGLTPRNSFIPIVVNGLVLFIHTAMIKS